jgi:hypothetical protein
MKKLLLVLLLVPTLAYADDHRVTSADGSCSISVPATLKGDKSIGISADKKVSAVVSHPKAMDTFDDVKSGAKSMYKGKVTKDTATELEIEGPSALNNKPSVYRAIASGKTFCLVEVDYESGTVDDARKIAHTLAAK